MSVELRRIYLENYKLFAMKEIVFEEYLSVFDGPNGYGKTSIFDAIEFLITGSISRIKESQSISGTLGYSCNFLAKDPQKDVIIKGEFINTSSSELLIIALRIPGGLCRNSRKNNPKSIDAQVENYLLPTYNIPVENWDGHKIERDILMSRRCAFFGAQNIEFFVMLHYIRQEDRLSYFKKTEADRTIAIEHLFGIESDISKAAQIDQAQKHLNQKLHSLDKEIEQISRDIQSLPQRTEKQAEYFALADGIPVWDHREFDFRGSKSNGMFEQLKLKISGIKELYLHKEEFFLSQDIKSFLEIPSNQKELAVLAWKIQSENHNSTQELQEKRNLLEFLYEQQKLINDFRFADVSWEKLCNAIGLKALSNQFLILANQIKNASANQTDLQKSLLALKRSREQLRKEFHHSNLLESGMCPYCGQNWKESIKLENQFTQTQSLIDSVLGRETEAYSLAVSQCKELFSNQCKPLLDNIVSGLEHDTLLRIFSEFPNWQTYQNAAARCTAVMARIGIIPDSIKIPDSLQDALHGVSSILDRVMKLNDTLSAEYYALDSKYHFTELYRESFGNLRSLDNLSIEALEQKLEYITAQYYHSFDESRNKLQILQQQRANLNSLYEQMKNYSNALQNAIKSYRQLIIAQIEIPFFLYSSRLLQSYQGGQGVLIKSDGKNVRFTAPGSEHDVLYTMSSGQLSAVLLAFSLALNKIYAGETFRAILIDDPIQCMDDINMISFVELLRREFNQSQIILSTHEDSFSHYIRYKFSKYNLSQQSITLKDA